MPGIDTVIVGGGQAGLSTSYYLNQAGREHVVLEQAAQAGNAWRNQRWDSFHLVTPNWSVRLPEDEYGGNDPDGFMSRQQIIRYFEEYVEKFRLPVCYNVPVISIEKKEAGYRVSTDSGEYQAKNVVVATGSFQFGKKPPFARYISPAVLQITAGEYRNPAALPAGAVLVVGSGQSGSQIAEELYQSGRKVYCSVSNVGRLPRRYRGQDIHTWVKQLGLFDRTVDQLASPRERFAGNPQLSGKDGGHTLNLHQFAREGVTLVGKVLSAYSAQVILADDLHENLAKMDKFELEFIKRIDAYIEKARIAAPEDYLPVLRNGYDAKIITEMDLRPAGITSVIWATGFGYDYTLVRLPVLDEYGYPIQRRGVTTFPGLFFVGMNWLYKNNSALLLGVGEDARYIAGRIADRASSDRLRAG